MRSFQEIVEAAGERGPLRFVVAQAADGTVLKAAAEARRLGIGEFTLVGRAADIREAAYGAAVDPEAFRIVEPPAGSSCAAEAVRAVRAGEAQVLVKGMLPTADLMREAVNPDRGLTAGLLLSHVGVFLVPGRDRFLLVTDAALNIAPDLKEKAGIVQNAIDLAGKLGIEDPVAAILCAVETVNPKMPATIDAACLSKMADRGQIRGGRVEGPLALDNAVDPEAARHKGIRGELAGHADILVVPDIEAGNVLYKALQWFAGAGEAGVVVGGAAPIVLTSRADSLEGKLHSLALGALAL